MRELLYKKIADSIRNDIERGMLAPEARLDGVRELAAKWGTSGNTVLKALGELEAAGYIRKTQGQGIFVRVRKADPVAVDAAAGRLELVLYDMNVPLNRMIVAAVEKSAADFGYILNVKSSRAPEDMCAADYPRIVVPESSVSVPESEGGGKSVIYIGDFSPPPDFHGSYAVADTYAGFFRAAGMLHSAGRERVAYIGATDNLEAEAGWNACRDLLSGTRHGFRRGYAVSAGGWDAEKGRAAMETLLLNDEFPNALICCNDTLAAGALRACRDAGLAVPEDVAVIGAGDQEVAPLLEPPLSSLKLPAALLGYTAVGFIDARRRGLLNEPCRLRADMELVERESSAEAAQPDDALEDGSLWL